MKSQSDVLYLDTTSLKCPILFVKTKQWLKKMQVNQLLVVKVRDKSGARDILKFLDKHQYDYTLHPLAGQDVEFRIKHKGAH